MKIGPAITIDALARDFLGLTHSDSVVDLDGNVRDRRRVYLDTTASSLMPRPVWKALQRYLEASYANSHTHVHRAGRATTEAIESARATVGELVGYDPERDQVLFTGNGATGALNYLARVLFPPEVRLWLRGNMPLPDGSGLDDRGERALARLHHRLARPLVVTTVMEHHSNLLPWVEAVGRSNIRAIELGYNGVLDMDHFNQIMEEEGERVSVVAITGTSNVTGIINDAHAIAKIAHKHGALVVIDAAQMAPHQAINMHPADPDASLDFVALSGHKMYAPGSRGALVGILNRSVGGRCIGDVGGGMAAVVSMEDFRIVDDITAREEAGTPNIPGTVTMGLAAQLLMDVGMENIQAREHILTQQFMDRLAAIEGVQLYGPTDLERYPRAGVITLNVRDLSDALVATYLDHGWNIAVRNGCFCAHPYVKRLLQIDDKAEEVYLKQLDDGDWRNVPGMVRVSLGVYSTMEDLDTLCEALTEISQNADKLRAAYTQKMDGSFVRNDDNAERVLNQRPFVLSPQSAHG
ncbi:MAG: hypothetical protein CMH54_11010 [Myxococcales bacterium]|nr:hypothetical protein [Myxococcales bacterium]